MNSVLVKSLVGETRNKSVLADFVSYWLAAVVLYVSQRHFASYFKRLLYSIFYIGPSMSPRFPYEAPERSWMADMCRGLIPGTILKLLCHKLFITYLTLTFFKHWLFYCRKNLWTDKLRKLILKRVAFVQLANILVSKRYQTGNVDLYNDVRKCLKKLPKKSTFGWKFLFNTTYTFELIILFQVI